jgi:hypothetical protein
MDHDFFCLYEFLYSVLGKERTVVKKISGRDETVLKTLDSKWIMPTSLETLTNLRDTRYRVVMMLQALTPFRIGILDGQQRMAGAIHAMVQRKPPINNDKIYNDLAEERFIHCIDQPNLKVFSKCGTFKFVLPRTLQPSDHMTSMESALCVEYSMYVQSVLSQV